MLHLEVSKHPLDIFGTKAGPYLMSCRDLGQVMCRLPSTGICAQFVPEDVGSGDLSDSVDSGISNLRV
jgi:hypothetical protein